MSKHDLQDVAELCLSKAKEKGAKEAAVRASQVRDVTVQWREGKLEKIQEATTRGVTVQLYVDGRYSTVNTSDLRPEALDRFLADSVTMTRALAPDPFRFLPEPELYAGQAKLDLQLEDAKHGELTPERRRQLAREAEEGARAVKGAESILSVTTDFNDTRSDVLRLNSNGFSGRRVDTQYWVSAAVTVKDGDGRRPEDYSAVGTRFLAELPSAAEQGRRAAERALARLGSKKTESARLTMVLDNRAAPRLMAALVQTLAGAALQQKRSFLEGKVGTQVASPLLTVSDEPHLVRGFGSRLFDLEGLAARRLPLFEKGVLRNYYVDTYYGRKLKMPATTGGLSNLDWALGTKTQAGLLADVKDAILVTGFLGGNSNPTTGDFSLGVRGFRVRGGVVGEPVAEMNVSGNMAETWKNLVAVGSDPYPYSTYRTPTLVFEGVQFAGL
jgi:PmbA protein